MNYRVDLSRDEVDKLLKKNDLKVGVLRKIIITVSPHFYRLFYSEIS